MSTVAETLFSRGPYGESSDKAGWLGSLYDSILAQNIVNRELGMARQPVIEVLAWFTQLRELDLYMGEIGRFVGGIHGLLGSSQLDGNKSLIQTAKLTGISKTMAPNRRVYATAERLKSEVYVLNHNLYLEQELADNNDALMPSPPNVIRAGENDSSPFCLLSLLSMRRLLGAMVYDPVHHANSIRNFNWYRDWEILTDTAHQIKPDIIHLSEGTDLSDSIPSDMPYEWYEDIAALVRSGTFPVFERQWGYTKGSLHSRPHRVPWIQKSMYTQTKKYKDAGAF